MEQWRQIEDSIYSVSSNGRVRNDKSGKILKQQLRNKYPAVRLYMHGEHNLFNVHRLATTAFIPNPNNLPCINHKDENKLNNYIHINEDGSVDFEKSNLEWCTHAYNCNYGKRNRKIGDRRKKETLCIFPDGTTKTYKGAVDAARELGLVEESVSASIRQGSSLHGYKFSYVPDNQ